MVDERERRAHELLRSAVEIDPSQRAAFVREACAGDAALAARVTALLSAVDRSRGFLETPALALRAEPPVDAVRPRDETIGGYRIVGVIGVGGMATVYEAMQERPRRRVALKVMKRGLERTSALHRFQFETEVLARLKHPGIAQIFEAGAHEDRHGSAIPFFAMEYICGARPITAHAREHALDVRERLRLFAEVCDAVQHGHLNGVIHRDLKPGNVLVDAAGHPKVIDFGIARSIDPAQAWITRQSDVGQLVGTLNFMSPEQCSAGDVLLDVRSDVYSLGIILYELMCGRLPHDLARVPVPEALRIVQQETPVRPGAIDPALRGDIEAIILRAIEKEPDRRYASVAALADDIRRHLRHEPIEARPPTLLSQCRLFARRNKAMVVAMAAIAAALLAATVVSTTFAFRTMRESRLRRAAESDAIVERDAARWQAYIANIAGAFAALQTDEFQLIRSRLAKAPEVFRRWEWGFLGGLAERSARTVAAHEEMIFAFAASPDGARLATGARDGTLRVWDAAGGTCVADLEAHAGPPILAVAFNADGTRVVAGAEDGTIRAWYVAMARPAGLVGAHEARVRSVACGPSGLVASASADGVARLWNMESGELVRTLDVQPGGIHGVAFSKDGATLATWNRGGSIWLRDGDGADVRQRLSFDGEIEVACLSADGARLAAGGAGGRVACWNADDGACIAELTASASPTTVVSLAFSPRGDRLACGLVQRRIVLWSLDEPALPRELRGHEEAVSGLAFGADGETLFSTSWDRTMRTWQLDASASPAAITTLRGHTDHVLAAQFSPDGSLLASGSRDGTIRLWDPELGAALGALGDDVLDTLGHVYAIDFSPDGRLIASGSDDRTVRLWNASTGEPLALLEGHDDAVWSVAFDPTGRRLASCGSDETIRIWDVATRETLRVLAGHTGRVIDVQFSPDGSLLASSSRDHSVRLWDAASGRLLHRLDGHQSDAFVVLFSADGALLYSGCRDQTVRVWNCESGACLDVLDGHGQFVTCMARSPDGTRLAAGSWFGEILLWDSATRDLVASFKGHDAAIRSVAFSPDGRWLASGSYDKTVRLLDSAPAEERTRRRAIANASRAEAAAIVDALLLRVGSVAEALHSLEGDGAIEPRLVPWIRKVLLERSLERARAERAERAR
ncbi:MAG: protein kinase [Phycisphaerales bacterium]